MRAHAHVYVCVLFFLRAHIVYCVSVHAWVCMHACPPLLQALLTRCLAPGCMRAGYAVCLLQAPAAGYTLDATGTHPTYLPASVLEWLRESGVNWLYTGMFYDAGGWMGLCGC